jgi:hypothetical protein
MLLNTGRKISTVTKCAGLCKFKAFMSQNSTVKEF